MSMLSDRQAMMDLETLGSAPGCPILSIGIVEFVPETIRQGLDAWRASLNTFKVNISLESCMAAGLTMSAQTIKWWMFQPEAARRDAFDSAADEISLLEACQAAAFVIDDMKDVRVWCHGAPFDVPILGAAMRAVGVKEPWNFRKVRDTRTIFEIAGIEYSGTYHEPVLDATAQAEAVSHALIKLADAQAAVPAAA